MRDDTWTELDSPNRHIVTRSMVYSFPHVRYNISANLRAAPAQNIANPVINIMSNEETLCGDKDICHNTVQLFFQHSVTNST